MVHIHIFSGDDGKFSLSFSEFINSNFDSKHQVIAFNNNIKHGNIVILKKNLIGLVSIINRMYNAKQIIIHSLSFSLTMILFLNPWLLKKSYWCIWGGDLYSYKYRSKSLKSSVRELFRRFVIKNMHGYVTQLRGDYDLVVEWYGGKGRYYHSFVYPSNLYKEYKLKQIEKDEEEITIQVGNSACETNNHIEVFEKLASFKNRNIKIICPLSYSGKEEYIKLVIEVGSKIFGNDKFIPITEFMPFDKYLELLSKVDIAIFNHKRQRGLGNITTLLGLGKKIYIREEITTWQFCLDNDLKVYSANDDFSDLFKPLDEVVKKNNVEKIKTNFSEKKLVDDLTKIFDQEIN